MIFLLPIIIAAIIIILFYGGKPANLLNVSFKHAWLVLVAVLAKVVSISGLFGAVALMEVINPYLRVLSLLLVVVFALLNISIRGVPVVGLGLLLNTLVIAVNGGNMPIDGRYAHQVFTASELSMLESGLPVDSFILSSSGARLSFLGDVLSIPWGGPLLKLFSVGDIIITLGGIIFVAYYLRRGQRGYR